MMHSQFLPPTPPDVDAPALFPPANPGVSLVDCAYFVLLSLYQIQVNSRVKNELKYASSLAKAGSVAVRGIYWDPSMAVTSIKTDHGLAFPVRLHNSFLLEEPCVVLGTPLSSGGHRDSELNSICSHHRYR